MALTKISKDIVAINAIQGTLIADNAITAVHIATNAVSGTLIADNAVTATHIAQNVITVTQLADDAVEADKIADGVITTNHLNKAMISSQTEVTAVAGDFLLIGDTSDSNSLKKIPISGITSLVSTFDADGAQVFNESGAAVDFRVEGDTEQNLLFVDGSADKIGIGTSSPASLLHIKGSGDAIRVESTNAGAGGAQVDLLHYTASPADDDVHGSINFGGYYSGTTSAYGSAIKSVWSDVSAKEAELQFFTRDDSNWASRMVINKDGNVGINCSNPQTKFVVQTADGGSGIEYSLGASLNYLQSYDRNASDYIALKLDGEDLRFGTNDGTERMRINNAGLIGIGDSPTNLTSEIVTITTPASGGGQGIAIKRLDSNSDQTVGQIRFSNNSTDDLAFIKVTTDGAVTSSRMRFFTNTGSGSTERMKILSDGEIVSGPSAMSDTYAPLVNGLTSDALVVGRHSTSGSMGIWRTNTMEFKTYHNGVGYILTYGSNGVLSGDFNDTSDVNLKENISSISDGTTVIKALRPVKFDWKASGKGNNQHGFIAQEVEKVLPDAVEGNDYVENETGLPDDEPAGNGKNMNSNAVLAHAVKAIQELEARIKVLEG